MVERFNRQHLPPPRSGVCPGTKCVRRAAGVEIVLTSPSFGSQLRGMPAPSRPIAVENGQSSGVMAVSGFWSCVSRRGNVRQQGWKKYHVSGSRDAR